MPKIRGIELDQNSPGVVPQQAGSPDAFGAPQAAGLARMSSAFGTLGQVGERISDRGIQRREQAEMSDLHAQISDTHAKFTGEWKDRMREADPGDKTVAPQFIQDYDDYIDKLRDSVTTRAGQLYFEKAVAQTRQHLMETAYSTQAELAGAKARQDFTSARDNDTYTLMNDPSSFETVLQRQKDNLSNYVATGGDQKAAIKLGADSEKELAKAAGRGWIRINPDLAKNMLDENKAEWTKHVGGELKHQLAGEADLAIRARRVEDDHLRLEQEKQRKEVVKKTEDQILGDIYSGAGSTKAILDNPALANEPQAKESMIRIFEHYTNSGGVMKTDGGVLLGLFDRIHAPDDDPKRIVDEEELNAYVGHGLGIDGLKSLRAEFQMRGTVAGQSESNYKKQFIAGAKNALVGKDPITGLADIKGQEQFQKFYFDFQDKWNEARKDGVPVRELVDPKSPKYLGNLAGTYKRSLEDQISDMANIAQTPPESKATPAAEPAGAPDKTAAPAKPIPAVDVKKARKPNETPAQYLKRMGME